jgi:hypothetical protein
MQFVDRGHLQSCNWRTLPWYLCYFLGYRLGTNNRVLELVVGIQELGILTVYQGLSAFYK